MAKGLGNYPNIIPASADFPNGQIKDNPGDGSGTPVNQFTNSDIQEFFAKMMRVAGITPNGNFDKDSNNEFLRSMVKLFDGDWTTITSTADVSVNIPSPSTIVGYRMMYKQTFRDVICSFYVGFTTAVTSYVDIYLPLPINADTSVDVVGSCAIGNTTTNICGKVSLLGPATLFVRSQGSITGSIEVMGEFRYKKQTQYTF